MGALSIWHLIMLAILLLLLVPVSRILKRVGLSPWLAVLFVIPVVSYAAVWVLAYVRWPKVDTRASAD